MLNKKHVLGIDPGKFGGWALIKNGAFLVTDEMPLVGNEIDVSPIARAIESFVDSDELIVVIEKVHSMPKQSSQSTFTFGSGFGKLIGMCQTLEISHDFVNPQVWKKRILYGCNKDKKATIEYVQRRWPDVSLVPEGRRVKHDGIADAVCIAQWGFEKYVSKVF